MNLMKLELEIENNAKPSPLKSRQTPLQCVVQDGVVAIVIGVNTLKLAANAECLERDWEVGDADEFARDVLTELSRENEAGDSMITHLLDSACVAAANAGSLAVSDMDWHYEKIAHDQGKTIERRYGCYIGTSRSIQWEPWLVCLDPRWEVSGETADGKVEYRISPST